MIKQSAHHLHKNTNHSSHKILFYLISVLIVYGSLYPFSFTMDEFNRASIFNLFNQAFLTSIGDISGNIILFVPLGIAGKFHFNQRSTTSAVFSTLFFSFLIAFLVQVAQMFLPERDAALSDVIWNVVGTLMGLSLAQLFHPFIVTLQKKTHIKSISAISLIALWLFWQLVPFIPSLDIQFIKNSIKNLWHIQSFSFTETLYITSTILVLGQLLSQSLYRKNTFIWLLNLILFTLIAKVFVITQVINYSTLSGFFIGLILWFTVKKMDHNSANKLVLLLFILSYASASLEPFQFSTSALSFNWIPFAGLLDGNMLTNTSAMAAKLFAYTSILWLSYQLTKNIYRPALFLAIGVLLLEIAQLFLPSRVSSISEPIWVLLSAWLLNTLLSQEALSERNTSEQPAPKDDLSANQFSFYKLISHFKKPDSWFIYFVIVCLIITMTIKLFLQLPGIPYNVKELFYHGGKFSDLFIFSLLLLWSGISIGWFSLNIASRSIPVFFIPIHTIIIGLVSYLLLINAVTHESISDIVGASNLYKQIVVQGDWGVLAKELFETFQLTGLANNLEQGTRYIALISPIILFFMISLLIVDRSLKSVPFQTLITITLSLPWLYLTKLIIVDWSSTDNLRELIAPVNSYGISGVFFLYLLLMLMCFNGAIVCLFSKKKTFFLSSLLITSISIPLSWFLLNQGLDDLIVKSNKVFSGIQFLLGPDRKEALSQTELFFRWCIVYLGFISILFIGYKFSSPSFLWWHTLKKNKSELISLFFGSKARINTLIAISIITIIFITISSSYVEKEIKTSLTYHLPTLKELPYVKFKTFKKQHPRLPAPSQEDIDILMTQNKNYFRIHKRLAKRGKLYSQILLAYAFPGEIPLEPLFQQLMALKFTQRGNVQTKPIALAYDWLYEQWSPESRIKLRGKLQEACDYQIHVIKEKLKLSPYNVYLYNSPLQALIAASLALHQDIPEADDHCMRFTHDYWTRRVVPVWKQIMGQNGGWHEGAEYVGIGIGQAIYQVPAMWLSATGEDYFRSISGIKGFLDFLEYRIRPDGTHFRWGDGAHFNKAIPDSTPLAIKFEHHVASKIKQESKPEPSSWPWGPLTTQVINDSRTKRPPPLTKLFDGIGLLVSRSDWSKDATYVTFKAGNNYWSHTHLDQGSFTIFKGGALAIDSGFYGPEYGSDHHMNYSYQSVAHNVVSVYDPDDTIPMPTKKKKDKDKPPRKIANDGGQRRIGSGWGKSAPLDLEDWIAQSDIYHTADIESTIEKNNTIAVVADLTPAYTNSLSGTGTFAHRTKRIENYKRIFIHDKSNDLIIIFDRVKTFKPDFSKKWLLHSLLEPAIDGQYFQIKTPPNPSLQMKGGSLKGKVLLPETFTLKKVGGKGLEFYVDGVNYDENGKLLDIAKRKKNAEPGQWRIELEPLNNSKDTIFLVAMKASLLNDYTALPVITTKKEKNRVICEINGQEKFIINLSINSDKISINLK